MKSIIFLFFIKLIISEICNYSFTCDLNENNDFCAIKKRTDSNSVFEISVKKCSLMPCNIQNTLLGELEKNTTCQKTLDDNIYKNPSYPGGVCTSDINCLSGICNNKNVCVDSEIGEECYNHENCPLNTACIERKCRKYLEDGEKCNDSYECQFDSFCNRHNNTCQKLFSVENGENINDYTLPEERIENICKSGGYIIEKDEKGKIIKKCENLTNIDYDCTDVCQYRKVIIVFLNLKINAYVDIINIEQNIVF